MAAAFVQSTSGTSFGSSTCSATFSGAVAAGNIIVGMVSWSSTTITLNTVVDTQGDTYTTLGTTVNSAAGMSSALFYSPITSGAGFALTVTASLSSRFATAQIVVHEISGISANAPIDQFGIEATGLITAGNAASPPAIVTRGNREYIFISADTVGTGGTAMSAGGGYTGRVLQAEYASADTVTTTTGTVAGNFTKPENARFNVGVIAFYEDPAQTGDANVRVVGYADSRFAPTATRYLYARPDTSQSAPTTQPDTPPSWPQARRLSIPKPPLHATRMYLQGLADTSASGPFAPDTAGFPSMRVVPYADATFPKATRNLLWTAQPTESAPAVPTPDTLPQWRPQQLPQKWIRPNFYGLSGSADDASEVAPPSDFQSIQVVTYDDYWYYVPPRMWQSAANDTGTQPEGEEFATPPSARFRYHVGKHTVAQWLIFSGAVVTEFDAPQQFPQETESSFQVIPYADQRFAPIATRYYRSGNNTDLDFPTAIEVNVNMRPVHVPTRHRVLAAYRFVPATDFAAPGAAATGRRRHPPWRRRQDQTFARVTGD